MAADACKVAVVFLVLATTLVFAQERCEYMTAIPREPRPDNLPPIEWSGGWSSRPLVPAPDRLDLCMDQYFAPAAGSGTGTQIIYMEEEIVEEVTIARLNYDGAQTPAITVPLLSGSFNMLGPVLRLVDGEWLLIITQRQDFETPGMQQYMFAITIPGETLTVIVSLQIVNIDDNAPIIQIFEACQVPELGEARLTECVYQVTDADGEISTSAMTFRIDSDREDDQIFYIQGNNLPNQWFVMNMTVGITEPLDFENNALHIFQVTALDSLPNTHTVTMMVQVENVEHRPPRWVEIFAVQQFDEKTVQNFTVRAIDGDTGINKPIYYRLERDEADTFFSIETIEGGRNGAIFHVDPIDRDALEQELFQLSIVAYKYDNESFATAANIVIIVNDVNDQIPEPLHDEYFVSIMEETPLTLNFEEEFGFHDRDLGAHAQYSLTLEAEYPPGAETAFYIAPQIGYQRQTFVMGTLNHSMLDYEVPEFQRITLKVIATDLDKPEHVGIAYLYIDLINWNDEEPIFEVDSQVVSFNETEGENFHVGNVRAIDRDIGDRVEHSLLGNAVNFLRIDEATGDVYVTANDSFDYHRQNELFVQVQAVDTLMEPYHTRTSQLVIQLYDINNTPPTLRLPRRSPHVEENVPEGYIISEEVTATDPDTTAHLLFEIDWNTTYATKQGRETDPVEFIGCIEIETIYPNPEQTGVAIGRVVVKEIRYNVTIDYEEFEVLFLTVRVRDLNTVIGDDYDQSTFTITIIDMNDNAPIWSDGTLTQAFRVREVSDSGVIIGTVLATDIDGPLYNQVRYTMLPRLDTPADLVRIDFNTGQISVDTHQAIDADVPRWHLYYTVIASDKCSMENLEDCPPDPTYWETEGEISIEIIDTNNKGPTPDTTRFDTQVYIYENATTGDEVVQLFSIDLDRDEIYNTVRYQINYAVNTRLRDFFDIDLDTGLVIVNYTTADVLDRDGDEPRHMIFVNIIDNFFSEGDGNRNQNATTVLVVLLDVNDNAPEMPDPDDLSWSISENLAAGITIEPEIYAPDRDEPDTDNSRVGYAILNLMVTNRDIQVPELFNMIQVQNVTGLLETAMPLRGYWGTYAIHIEAFDHGIPQQRSNETYELVVRPYNFHEPVFVFPESETTIRLSRERAVVGGMLATIDDEFLDRIHATDEDGLHAGQVSFTVAGNSEAVSFFEVVNEPDNLGILRLTQMFSEDIREFQVTLRATDGGDEPHPLYSESTFTVVFVPTQGDPVFAVVETNVAFFEREQGMLERFQLPLATDPKNHLCDGDCHDIYYRIVGGNENGHFGLDPIQNIIFLETPLDRQESVSHTLTVAASNTATDPGTPLPGATITVLVTVREADPRPYFERNLYTAGISTLDSINRELLTVHATHTEGVPITYTIDHESMIVDSSLEAVRDSAFVLNPTTGVLLLNIQPNAAMHGMFEFNVVATDTAGETDEAEVRIYVISTVNRVFFLFFNTIEQVEANRDFIARTFSEGFRMTCNIDQVLPSTDSNGVAQDNMTEVRAHFILDDMPVSADVIEELRSDTILLRSIQATLDQELLVLDDFVTDSSPDASSNANQVTVYVLAALSAILAFMCLVLLLTFIIRTRALNRRLEALSMTKYGSVDSGLNRAGLAAPGTNKHAIEGSNPIWNEAIKAPDFDAISDASGDSDLIGIEDMPQFRSDYFPPEDTGSGQGIINNGPPNSDPPSVANHSNGFGFNTSPFSNEFTNKQFRRM